MLLVLTKKNFFLIILSQLQTKHHAELKTNIERTQSDLSTKQGLYEKHNAMLEKCGCCCDDQPSLKMNVIHARDDVTYLEKKIPNLEDQVEALKGWCMA